MYAQAQNASNHVGAGLGSAIAPAPTSNGLHAELDRLRMAVEAATAVVGTFIERVEPIMRPEVEQNTSAVSDRSVEQAPTSNLASTVRESTMRLELLAQFMRTQHERLAI